MWHQSLEAIKVSCDDGPQIACTEDAITFEGAENAIAIAQSLGLGREGAEGAIEQLNEGWFHVISREQPEQRRESTRKDGDLSTHFGALWTLSCACGVGRRPAAHTATLA